MSFLELARKRCSIRKYAPKNVEQEKIDYILEAARLAPSAVNYQPWYFVWVQSAEGKAKLQECYPREWFKQAPYYLIVCGDHQQSWKRGDHKDHMDIDAAIATEHICLAAAEQGLGTCWVCNFDTELCRKHFKIPEMIFKIVLFPAPAGPSIAIFILIIYPFLSFLSVFHYCSLVPVTIFLFHTHPGEMSGRPCDLEIETTCHSI